MSTNTGQVVPDGRTGGWRPVAVGVVVAALVALGGVTRWVMIHGGTTTAGAARAASLTCPASVRGSAPDDVEELVPAPPSASGVDDRLVPARAPRELVACDYPAVISRAAVGATPAPGVTSGPAVDGSQPPARGEPSLDVTLARSATLDGADARVAALLATVRQAPVGTVPATPCAWPAPVTFPPEYGDALADRTSRLLGLRYDDGVVWVATTPFTCPGLATNGVAATPRGPIDAAVDAVLDLAAPADGATDPPGSAVAVPPSPVTTAPTRSAPEVEPPTVGSPSTVGRPTVAPSADDPPDECPATIDTPVTSGGVLVPFHPTAVRVCRLLSFDADPGSPTPKVHPTSVAADLAARLDALPVLPPDTACIAIGGPVWQLLFTAADGAQASVRVDAGGCGTAAAGSLTRLADPDLFTVVDRLA